MPIYVTTITVQKMKFCIKDFFSVCDNTPQETADLATFTHEILNAKLHVLYKKCCF